MRTSSVPANRRQPACLVLGAFCCLAPAPVLAEQDGQPCQNAATLAVQVEAATGDLLVYESRAGPVGQGGWGGTLLKYRLPAAASPAIEPANAWPAADSLLWDAAERLTGSAGQAPQPPPGARRLFTAGRRGHAWHATALRWEALAEDQRAGLDRPFATAERDGLGALRLEYLRGERSRELGGAQGLFRQRFSLLGETAPGAPAYAGPPAASWSDPGYRRFAERQRQRPPTVYVSADNGMLHAFDAHSGVERFAYLPAALIPGVPAAIAPERPPHAALLPEIGIGEARVREEWKTVLAAGMGAAARGVVALDVTQPDGFGEAAGVLFEFTEQDDPDIGHVGAAPKIVKMLTGLAAGVPQHAYFLALANGLAADAGANHPAALFLLSLDKDAGQPWLAGVNYHKLLLPAGPPGWPNGTVAPAFLSDMEGSLQRLYLADVQGRLWRLELAGRPLSDWHRNPPSPLLLFVAMDDQGREQAITLRPRILHAPGGHLVLFATGGKPTLEEETQAAGDRVQSFYAVHDAGPDHGQRQHRADLLRLSLQQHPALGMLLAPESAQAVARAGGLGWITQGWFFDLPAAEGGTTGGVSAIHASQGQLAFSIPAGCRNGRHFMLDLLRPPAQEEGAASLQARLGGAGASLLVDASLLSSVAGDALKEEANPLLILPAASAASAPEIVEMTRAPTAGHGQRLSWREILNWQELRHALQAP